MVVIRPLPALVFLHPDSIIFSLFSQDLSGVM
jgi:hypothetical protein